MKNKHMTKEMRERIEEGIRNGETLKEIAHAISKDPTTISKEVFKHRSKYIVDCETSIHVSTCYGCSHIKECNYIKLCGALYCHKKNAKAVLE